MGLKKLTFDDALNTAKDDAFFNWYLTKSLLKMVSFQFMEEESLSKMGLISQSV